MRNFDTLSCFTAKNLVFMLLVWASETSSHIKENLSYFLEGVRQSLVNLHHYLGKDSAGLYHFDKQQTGLEYWGRISDFTTSTSGRLVSNPRSRPSILKNNRWHIVQNSSGIANISDSLPIEDIELEFQTWEDPHG